MIRIILSLLITTSVCVSLSGQVSPKRGLGYGFHSEEDIAQVATGCSWWYNWSTQVDTDLRDGYAIENYGVEFIPMVWNDNFDVQTVIDNIPDDARYLLAFNEPNFNVEANMSPEYAASQWYKVEQVADAKGLEIVGPAVAWCGGDVCNGTPEWWYDEFFANCPGCRVDHVAFHSYANTPGDLFGELSIMRKYNLPIWLTEFAHWYAPDEAAQIAYMESVVATMENDPDIYRYAWFIGRHDEGHTIVNILGANGQLTNLGTAYMGVDYPVAAIPGVVQAEIHYRRRGTDTEPTEDVGGGENVGWTDAGDWVEYLVDVDETGAYTFEFRIAGEGAPGNITITLDGESIAEDIDLGGTGGWQDWETVTVNDIVLTEGQHLLRFLVNTGGFNLNYFNTFYQSGIPATADFDASPVSACIGGEVAFTDMTINKSGSETYAWDFGADADPPTAVGVGPHVVTYSADGQKTVSLTVTNDHGTDAETKVDFINVATPPTACLFSDAFDDETVAWITPVPGAFSHEESGTEWIISNEGYGEWENFTYTLNDGTDPAPLNFACTTNRPLLKIRARASGTCMLNVSLVDANGRAVDNYDATSLELTDEYQEFTIDFAGQFENHHSGNPGILDSAVIDRIQLAVNPGYASFPYEGDNATYNTAFDGTVHIEWMGIGDNCAIPPLPVELLDFQATRYEDHVQLSWSTASETDNDFFDIERSEDGVTFQSIGTVPGQGTSSEVVHYTFDDNAPLSGVTYYRLRQVDNDGSYTYSLVISVPAVVTNAADWLSVSPNPVQSSGFTVTIHTTQPEPIMDVYSITGVRVYSRKLTAEKTVIQGSELALTPGMYVVTLRHSGSRDKLIVR